MANMDFLTCKDNEVEMLFEMKRVILVVIFLANERNQMQWFRQYVFEKSLI